MNFTCYYSRAVKKLWYFRKQNISRGKENYVKFFAACHFENECRNSNLMNTKIVTFACHFSRIVKKLWYFIKKYITSKRKLSEIFYRKPFWKRMSEQ